jgi:hypothetical protein
MPLLQNVDQITVPDGHRRKSDAEASPARRKRDIGAVALRDDRM